MCASALGPPDPADQAAPTRHVTLHLAPGAVTANTGPNQGHLVAQRQRETLTWNNSRERRALGVGLTFKVTLTRVLWDKRLRGLMGETGPRVQTPPVEFVVREVKHLRGCGAQGSPQGPGCLCGVKKPLLESSCPLLWALLACGEHTSSVLRWLLVWSLPSLRAGPRDSRPCLPLCPTQGPAPHPASRPHVQCQREQNTRHPAQGDQAFSSSFLKFAET